MKSMKQSQKVRTAFDSILRTDYISIDNIEQMKNLDKYYIDFYNNIGGLLQKQDNFISGRRGTGKTALLYRGYYECLKTISPKLDERSPFFNNEDKILPIFINLTTCNELLDPNNDQKLLEIHFIRQIIENLKRQLNFIFDDTFLRVFKKENPALQDLDYIEQLLIKGIPIKHSSLYSVEDTETSSKNSSVDVSLSISDAQLGGKQKETNKLEKTTKKDEIRGLNVQEFLNKINDIRKKAKIDCIYIFIDEFSDMNTETQEKFSNLLKNFLGSKNELFFKIGTITDRYTFGNKIITGRDIFPISLDFNEYVERYGGAVTAVKQTQRFAEQVVSKRLEIFCPELKFSDVFSIKEDLVYQRISLEVVGVPRTIGLILQNAWIQCQNVDTIDKKIGIAELNYGIRTARKTYYKQFEGAVKKGLIPEFYMDLWNDLLGKAIAEKNKNAARPSSHFMINPEKKHYLNIYCENFLIHFLEENRTAKYGGKFNLYCIDYDFCTEYNIKFAELRDEFSSQRFVYDDILSKYDPYFTKDRIKSYKCPKCGNIYDENQLGEYSVKRCIQDDEKLIEIIHKSSPTLMEEYTEVETKIIGMITSLKREEAMTAKEIADAVGCNKQKVAVWGSLVLVKKQMINTFKEKGKNRYYSSDS
jgi:hypothetical protein